MKKNNMVHKGLTILIFMGKKKFMPIVNLHTIDIFK